MSIYRLHELDAKHPRAPRDLHGPRRHRPDGESLLHVLRQRGKGGLRSRRAERCRLASSLSALAGSRCEGLAQDALSDLQAEEVEKGPLMIRSCERRIVLCVCLGFWIVVVVLAIGK